MYHDVREIDAEQMIDKLVSLCPDYLEFSGDDRMLLMLIVVARVGKPSDLQLELSQQLLQNSFVASMDRKKLGQLMMYAKRVIRSDRDATDLLIHLAAKLIASKLGIDYRHPKLVAALVGTVQSTLSTPLVEVMPNTAELSLGLLGEGPRRSFPMVANVDGYLGNLINIRLAAEGIRANFIPPERYKRFAESTFLFDSPYVDQAPLFNAMHRVLSHTGQSRLVVIQNWTRAKTSGLWKEMQALIFGRAYVEAIIDFSSLPSASDHCTAIILSTEGPQEEVLYIDVSMANTSLKMDGIERMLLAGCIYNLWQDRHFHRGVEYLSGEVVRFLNNYFLDGFKPILGLCNTSKKLPKTMTKTRRATGEFLEVLAGGVSQRRLTDTSKMVADQLAKHPKACCVYVIGNNGEGKSFLLRDIVYRLAQVKKNSIGIPMSHAHRFPVDDTSVSTFFECQGAGHKRIMPNIRAISSRPDKVALLNECLGLVGFSLRTLLTLKSKSDLDRHGDPRRDELDLAVEEHVRYLNSDRGAFGAYTLNFVRGEHRMTAFEHLSSGEQSILNLLIKIIASDALNTTFLIDEPEISLHVGWQQMVPRIFTLLSDRLGASFVVATHSAVLIAKAANDDICYVSRFAKLKEIPVDERHSVETLLMDGFGTYTPHNREVHERCAKVVASIISAANTPDVAVQVSKATDKLEQFEESIRKELQIGSDERTASDLDLVQKTLGAVSMLLRQSETSRG